MPESIGKLLNKARRAYKTGERGAAAYYIDKILRQDYNHSGTWKLLYGEYGSGQSLKEFQREFTQQYYPDKLALISGTVKARQPEISQSERRPFLSRILSRWRWRSRKTGKAAADDIPELQPTQSRDRQAARSNYPGDTQTATAPRVSLTPEAASPDKSGTYTQSTQPEKSAQIRPERPAPDQYPSPALAPIPLHHDKTGNIRVIVVDDTAQTRETIVRSLSFQREVEIIATAENGLQAIALARQTLPDVVLMDINMPDMDGITATAGVLHEVPYAQVIILTVQDDPDYMRKAMMAGAHDFLTKPPSLDELLNAVQNAGKVAHQEKRKAAQSRLPSSRLAPSLSSRGKIVSIHSPKGGAGCSMVSVNLAASLHNNETKAVIVDSNLYYGDITDLFNMQSENTMFDLAMRTGNLDFQMVEETLIAHESGIHLLAPPGPEQAGYINTEQFIDVVENLRDLYPYVLVNTTSNLTEATIAALEISDLIILLVTQDIPTVARVRKFFDTTELLNIKPQRIVVVLNRYDKQSEINPEIISKAIRHNIDAQIPRDIRVVVPSVNRGIPFMLRSDLKPLPISKAMLDLAEKVRQRLIQVAYQGEAEESAGSHPR